MFSMGLKRYEPALMAFCLFFLFAGLCYALEGQVMKVKDGDTVVIKPITDGEAMTCRLYGIDAPEKSQPFGKEASKELKSIVLGKTITVTPTGAKTYNRDICRLSKDDMDINLEMVKSFQ